MSPPHESLTVTPRPRRNGEGNGAIRKDDTTATFSLRLERAKWAEKIFRLMDGILDMGLAVNDRGVCWYSVPTVAVVPFPPRPRRRRLRRRERGGVASPSAATAARGEGSTAEVPSVSELRQFASLCG
eukprot:COSAG01_NODE_6885_length_3451_cov_13.005370_4_plen_128_part_00